MTALVNWLSEIWRECKAIKVMMMFQRFIHNLISKFEISCFAFSVFLEKNSGKFFSRKERKKSTQNQQLSKWTPGGLCRDFSFQNKLTVYITITPIFLCVNIDYPVEWLPPKAGRKEHRTKNMGGKLKENRGGFQ